MPPQKKRAPGLPLDEPTADPLLQIYDAVQLAIREKIIGREYGKWSTVHNTLCARKIIRLPFHQSVMQLEFLARLDGINFIFDGVNIKYCTPAHLLAPSKKDQDFGRRLYRCLVESGRDPIDWFDLRDVLGRLS